MDASRAMNRVVLASTSPYRRALLEQLGIPFEVANPELDEEPYKAAATSPESLVTLLAEAKARAVARAFPDALVIGSDQCAAIDDAILHKPLTPEGALTQLSQLQGRTHRLLTGVAVVHGASDRADVHLDVHRLTMRPLSRAQLLRYIAHDDPLQCAGSYRIEGRGVALFERVEGEDSSAIVGLPLMAVTTLLGGFGYDVLTR